MASNASSLICNACRLPIESKFYTVGPLKIHSDCFRCERKSTTIVKEELGVSVNCLNFIKQH